MANVPPIILCFMWMFSTISMNRSLSSGLASSTSVSRSAASVSLRPILPPSVEHVAGGAAVLFDPRRIIRNGAYFLGDYLLGRVLFLGVQIKIETL